MFTIPRLWSWTCRVTSAQTFGYAVYSGLQVLAELQLRTAGYTSSGSILRFDIEASTWDPNLR